MKKKIKVLISCMLVTLMLIPNTMVFATSSQTDDEQLAENIIAIENELKDCGTDVETELINMIDEYKIYDRI